MKKQDKRIFPIDDLHKIRELEQENILLEAVYQILDDKNQSLEESRTILKQDLQQLMRIVQNNQKRYMDLYEQSPDLYRTINTDGVILDCNNIYATKLGYSKEEIIGKTIFDHSPENIHQGIMDSFETWKRTGYVRNKEIWIKCKDGSIFPGLISATNLYDMHGKLIGSNSVIKDISEMYQYRKELEESRTQIQIQLIELQKLDMAKDEFLAMITHELKTPIVPIKSYVEMILSEKLGPLNDTQKNRLSVVQSNMVYLLKILNDLLDVQKIELGQLKLTKNLHDLAGIVEKTIDTMREDMAKKGISITINIQSNLVCLCDDVRIEQVLTNLLVNAVKFSTVGNGKISVKMYPENDWAKIIVKDNGIGINGDKLEQIFVKFYQMDNSSTREYGGTGLGLSVCKGLIENHGGKIWAESEGVNKGAEIHILLPLAK
jgi:PAS domain S-box-containing protein